MDGINLIDSAIIEPAVRYKPESESSVRPDANRVVFSTLVGVTVTPIRKIPFGCLGLIPLTEEWFPVNDVPPHARHRVSPDPNDQSTWGDYKGDKLPKPRLASALTTSDLMLARVLRTYFEVGCREIEALRDKSAAEIRTTQKKLFGDVQMLTYAQTVQAIKTALDQHKDDRLVTATAREIMKLADETLRNCELYWQSRKTQIMRAANGDKTFTAHPDNYDLRICEYAGIDVTMTEADALRAEVLKKELQPQAPAGPSVDALKDAMKSAVEEGIKAGLAAVASMSQPATQSEQKGGKQAR